MSITVGDVLKVVATLAWTDGNLMQNVFNAAITGSGGPFDDDDIVDDAVAWVGVMFANLVAAISNAADGSQVQVYVYDSTDDDFDEVGTAAWTFNPTNADHQLPRGVAALLNAKTLDPDVQGKKYVGGLTEGTITDGLWPTATLTPLSDFGDDWVTQFVGSVSGADWTPGVWSPKNTNIFPFSGQNIVPTIPAYQRRRKRGVGV